ncbi:MAG: ABC transporter ATP-binding protein [Anaerolineales bacterium]
MPRLTPDPVIQTVDLRREYPMGRDTVVALGGVNLTILKGEFVAIMGPSGSGKSTLLNLLGGLDQPTSGKVILDGHDLSAYTEEELAALRRQKMGFIFQRHDLFPVLTVRENVEFPMLLNGLSLEERRARSGQLLNLVGLAEKADSLPEELSGGQQQRVGIARALANAASILLADEPTGNLDSATSEDIIDSLIALKQARSLTLIMVTHDPEVAAHADRVLQLKDGKLLSLIPNPSPAGGREFPLPLGEGQGEGKKGNTL